MNLIKLNWGENPLQEGKVSSIFCLLFARPTRSPTAVQRPKAREARTTACSKQSSKMVPPAEVGKSQPRSRLQVEFPA